MTDTQSRVCPIKDSLREPVTGPQGQLVFRHLAGGIALAIGLGLLKGDVRERISGLDIQVLRQLRLGFQLHTLGLNLTNTAVEGLLWLLGGQILLVDAEQRAYTGPWFPPAGT